MKSGLPPAARAIRSRSSPGIRSGISSSTSSSPSGSSRSVTGQAGRRSTSSGRAMQSSRIGAPEERSATCSIRSRNVSSPHWMSSKTTTSGRSPQPAPASCGRPRRSPPPTSPPRVSPSSERIAAAAASSGGQHVELLQHLDDRPVGDPLAVGEAAAADDRRLDRGQTSATSRDLPTPASPTTVTSSQRCSACARSHASRRSASSRSRPTNRASCRRSGASRTRSSR